MRIKNINVIVEFRKSPENGTERNRTISSASVVFCAVETTVERDVRCTIVRNIHRKTQEVPNALTLASKIVEISQAKDGFILFLEIDD